MLIPTEFFEIHDHSGGEALPEKLFNSPDSIAQLIVDIPDFPKPGIIFKDITPILEAPGAYRGMIAQLAKNIPAQVTKIAAIESRGFLIGAPLAAQLGLGLVLVRKKGKLPGEVVQFSYDLEYGTDTLEIHSNSLNTKDTIIIVDDVLATGGTAHATEQLCGLLGARVHSFHFLMEVSFLKGKDRLVAPSFSLLQV
jgi:adenine phosphoribosyltransferase